MISFLQFFRQKMAESVCSVLGHDYMYHFGYCQIWLVCEKCHRRTTGWDWSDIARELRLRFRQYPVHKLGPSRISVVSEAELANLKKEIAN